MEYLHELKEKLCDELEEIAKKPDMSAGDLETVHKLTDTIKNIDKIDMLEDDGGYSRDGDLMARGTYDRGSSYARKRDSMGRYSRRMGNRVMYSRADAKDHMMGELEEAMNAASTDREREIIRRAMDQIEKA